MLLARELHLADRWQRGFPLCPSPFAAIAGQHGMAEAEVIDAFSALHRSQMLSRIGAVVKPNIAGASTLAAISCSNTEIEHVAAIVSAERYVNHNYERDHPINLWFVIAAPDEAELARSLDRVRRKTGHEVLKLRLQRAYHIDLGFPLSGGRTMQRSGPSHCRGATAGEKILLGAIEDGLPICSRPYAAVAAGLGWPEEHVIGQLSQMLEAGIVTRLGCVLRHREIGFKANAMVVWNVPDEAVDAAGQRLAEAAHVTLCYRRNRVLPDWPYNLFAMLHGRDEGAVRQHIKAIMLQTGLHAYDSSILFSRRCFVQRGARFSPGRRSAA
jgi:DNA-binding Lrp family transcriptional regulator